MPITSFWDVPLNVTLIRIIGKVVTAALSDVFQRFMGNSLEI